MSTAKELQAQTVHLREDLEWSFIERSVIRRLLHDAFVHPECNRVHLVLSVMCEELGAAGGFLGIGPESDNRTFADSASAGDLAEPAQRLAAWLGRRIETLCAEPTTIDLRKLGIRKTGRVLVSRVYIPERGGKLLGVVCLSRHTGNWPNYQSRGLAELIGLLIWFFASSSLPEFAREVLDDDY